MSLSPSGSSLAGTDAGRASAISRAPWRRRERPRPPCSRRGGTKSPRFKPWVAAPSLVCPAKSSLSALGTRPVARPPAHLLGVCPLAQPRVSDHAARTRSSVAGGVCLGRLQRNENSPLLDGLGRGNAPPHGRHRPHRADKTLYLCCLGVAADDYRPA